MTIFHVSDEVGEIAKKTATSAGYVNVDEFVSDLILQSKPLSAEFERELIKAFEGGSRVIPPEEWEAKRNRLRGKMSASKP
jgi:hypothetical protein